MKYENWMFGKDGALFSAAAKGNMDLVRELFQDGANINVVSPNGFTPLHRAAQNGHQDIVAFLLQNGADTTPLTRDGKTALDLAAERGHAGVTRLFAG